jgi:hypothetical protein
MPLHPSPLYYPDDESFASLLSHGSLAAVLDEARKADIVLVSCGDLSGRSQLFSAMPVTPRELNELKAKGAGGFDREPGVAVLELLRGHVARSRVERAGIVDLVDKSRKILCDVGEGLVCHRVDGFDLERLHEALRLGVIVRIAAPAHRADQALTKQGFPKSLALDPLENAVRRNLPSDGRKQRPFAYNLPTVISTGLGTEGTRLGETTHVRAASPCQDIISPPSTLMVCPVM